LPLLKLQPSYTPTTIFVLKLLYWLGKLSFQHGHFVSIYNMNCFANSDLSATRTHLIIVLPNQPYQRCFVLWQEFNAIDVDPTEIKFRKSDCNHN